MRAGGLFRIAAGLLLAAGFVIYLALAGAMPVTIMTWQWADDGLFLKLAAQFAQGHWFGGYNYVTLVKSPFFPVFIGAFSITGLPYNLAIPLVHLGASLAFSYVVFRITGSRVLFVVLLAVLLLTPGMYLSINRVVRNSFYASLFLFYAAALLSMLYVCKTLRARLIMGLVTGLAMALVWLTREETFWFVPVSLLLILVAAIQNGWLLRDRPEESGRFGRVRHALPFVVLLAGFFAVNLAFSGINAIVYGRFETVEMTDASMQNAMKALYRVGAVYDIPYIPVPKQAREDIATQSEAFARIFPHFTTKFSESVCKMLPTSCGDIAGGWLFWELRIAAGKAGVHETASGAAAYYQSLADEVNAACDDGRLTCVQWVPPLIPPMPLGQLLLLPEKIVRGVGLALYQNPPTAFSHPASGAGDALNDAVALLNRPLMTDEEGQMQASPAIRFLHNAWQRMVTSLTGVYGGVSAAGIVAFLIMLAFAHKFWRSPLLAIALFSYGTAATMIVVLALMDVSSFPAVYYTRFPIIHVLVVAGAIVSIYQLLMGVREGLQNRQGA